MGFYKKPNNRTSTKIKILVKKQDLLLELVPKMVSGAQMEPGLKPEMGMGVRYFRGF